LLIRLGQERRCLGPRAAHVFHVSEQLTENDLPLLVKQLPTLLGEGEIFLQAKKVGFRGG